MSKLILAFNKQVIRSYPLEGQEVLIGRAEENAVQVDSSRIADQHARVFVKQQRYHVQSLDPTNRVLVNGQPVQEQELKHGDVLTLGDYRLTFVRAGQTVRATRIAPEEQLERLVSAIEKLPTGYVQIMSGPSLGRIIQLNRSLTRLGTSGHECAVIAHREDGHYYLSHLEGESLPRVNNRPIGERTARLRDGDTLLIGHTRMQFHYDND